MLPAWLFLAFAAQGQRSRGDTAKSFPIIHVSYTADLPGGDLKHRFGWNSEIGLGLYFKRKNNWMYGVDASFIAGGTVKDSTLFQHIDTQDGLIIGSDGDLVNYRIYERGYKLPVLKFGRLFRLPLLHSTVNSGVYVLGGMGFMQHKIKIQDVGKNFNQIRGDYIKGYDRLTNGIVFTQNIGYMYVGHNNLTNFHLGLEFSQAFTQSRRSYNFDMRARDDTERLDLLFGFRLGWMIPLYTKMASGYYYR